MRISTKLLRAAALVGVLSLLAAAVVPSTALSQSIDPGDCESAASRLRRDARDLEDAAGQLDTEDRDERRSAESDVRSKAFDVRSSADRAVSRCGSSSAPTASQASALANIRGFLAVRFGETQQVKDRIRALDRLLNAIAILHVKAAPPDYRMAFGAAEIVFLSDATGGLR